MKALIISLFALASVFPILAQAQLQAELTGCQAPPKLFEFNGVGFSELATLKADGEELYSYNGDFEGPTFLYLGTAANNAVPIIVGGDKPVTVSGGCRQLRAANVQDQAGINQAYKSMKASFEQFAQRSRYLVGQYKQALQSGDAAAVEANTQALAQLDQQKRQLVQTQRQDHPLLGRIAAVNTYLSYQAQNEDRFGNEIDYYVNTYFQFTDFDDEGYNELPWTYESSKLFAAPLLQVISGDQLLAALLGTADRWPEGSRAQFFAMSGMFASLMNKKSPLAIRWADLIVERFGETYPEAVESIRDQSATLATFVPGAPAPELEGRTPEGENLKLSDLRGQYVLLDFWASWCGPCRRENPNVVRLYNQYHERGFEILGVSLDRTADRWTGAIEQDQLGWKHISDLKGWQSAHAKAYGVSSIPETILLDPEGRIVARGLRGEALHAKLAELLGSGR